MQRTILLLYHVGIKIHSIKMIIVSHLIYPLYENFTTPLPICVSFCPSYQESDLRPLGVHVVPDQLQESRKRLFHVTDIDIHESFSFAYHTQCLKVCRTLVFNPSPSPQLPCDLYQGDGQQFKPKSLKIIKIYCNIVLILLLWFPKVMILQYICYFLFILKASLCLYTW